MTIWKPLQGKRFQRSGTNLHVSRLDPDKDSRLSLAEGTCTLIYLEVQTVFGDLSGSIMYGLDTVIHATTNRTAKIAQHAKIVHLASWVVKPRSVDS